MSNNNARKRGKQQGQQEMQNVANRNNEQEDFTPIPAAAGDNAALPQALRDLVTQTDRHGNATQIAQPETTESNGNNSVSAVGYGSVPPKRSSLFDIFCCMSSGATGAVVSGPGTPPHRGSNGANQGAPLRVGVGRSGVGANETVPPSPVGAKQRPVNGKGNGKKASALTSSSTAASSSSGGTAASRNGHSQNNGNGNSSDEQFEVEVVDSTNPDYPDNFRRGMSSPNKPLTAAQAIVPRLLGPVPVNKRGEALPCLVLDLDETLVHSSFQPVQGADFIIPVTIEGVMHNVFVIKRPGVDEFLHRAAKHFELIIYTASLSKYADPLLDRLDPHNYLAKRLFREHCVFHQGHYVKDLSLLNRDLSRTIIIDNSNMSYIFHPEHAIDCGSFIDDPADVEMWQIMDFLEFVKDQADVRDHCVNWRPWVMENPSSVPVKKRAGAGSFYQHQQHHHHHHHRK